jgi:murein DD-endopeptidase
VGERTFGSADLAVLALFAGDEPVRYARDRLTASGLDLTLENAAKQLPPGFEGQVVLASQAMTFGVAYGLGWPVSASTRVTSPFGSRIDPVTGRQHVHTGVDLGVPEGTAVHAVAAGVVRRAGEDAVCGRLVVLDHGHGVTTAYCHNSEVKVSAGQTLAAGDVIAWSGNTGRSTGPHLHYQLALLDHPVDPFSFHARPSTTPSGGSL